ncbi:hypothetical protein EJ08DRAFT_339828 [Tothia fuscella]|uniref:Uncharacterized protein n=1 Tax=Tothia fuscella TaxID=1048955 RepID=A0A9P4U3X7_9PEZI|nr:hypothetical protein EJ08DRAFT_339828 [Tothia fuscella]
MAEQRAPLTITLSLPEDDLPPQYSKAIPQTHQRILVYPRSAPHSQPRFLPEAQTNEAESVGSSTLPLYTAFDETIKSFTLQTPFIYTLPKESSPRPRYQLSQEHSKSGKLWRLRIRRLLPTESRRLSIPTPGRTPRVDFDDDTTLYLIENLGALSVFKGQNIEIRGRRAKTLPGHITIRSYEDRKSEFWHMTRNPAGDSLRKENERKMQKYGYRSDQEWNRKLLFSAVTRIRGEKVDWQDENDRVIATETLEGGFDVIDGVNEKTRDALITCWVARRWGAGNLSWEAQEDKLSRAVSMNGI